MPSRYGVMGFSLGGIVALEMAAQAPERIAGLALVGANARPDPAENAAIRRAAVVHARREGLRAHLTIELWPSYVPESTRHDTVFLTQLCDMAERLGLDVYEEQAEIAIMRADSRPRLAQIRVPALIVSGAADVLNPADRQAELMENLPDAKWVELPDIGHFIPLEAPCRLATATTAWLSRVDNYAEVGMKSM